MFGIKVRKKEKEGETENGSPSWQTTARLVGRGGGWQGGTVQSPALESGRWRVEVLESETVPSCSVVQSFCPPNLPVLGLPVVLIFPSSNLGGLRLVKLVESTNS